MLSFYTNQLIIYLSMKKYFLIKKKKLYKNLILCVIVFLRSSTTLAFAVWIIPICSFSCDHNIILFFTYVNVFIFLSFFSICHMLTELSEINLVLSCLNKPMVISEPRCTKLLVILSGFKIVPQQHAAHAQQKSHSIHT